MRKESVRAVFKALNDEGVRFLLAGGLAVNAHGVLRFTADIDLVVQLVAENIARAFAAMERVGYRPIVPVSAESFADPRTRESWIRDKGMRVLRFHSDEHWETPVDFFAEEPFPFDQEYARAPVRDFDDELSVRVLTLETLQRLKQEAGRPKDLADLDDLTRRMEDRGEET